MPYATCSTLAPALKRASECHAERAATRSKRWIEWDLPRPLLGQLLGALHLERPCHRRRTCIRLPTSHRQRIPSFCNDHVSGLAHHAEIAIFQLESHSLRFPRLQMDTLESPQGPERSSRQ